MNDLITRGRELGLTDDEIFTSLTNEVKRRMGEFKRCRQDVYQRGEVISMESTSPINAECKAYRLRKENPGYWVDWHYLFQYSLSGRAVFKKLRKPWWRRILS